MCLRLEFDDMGFMRGIVFGDQPLREWEILAK